MANLGSIKAYRQGVQSVFQSTLRPQDGYRLSEIFEPALEFHTGHDAVALGQVIKSLIRASRGEKFRQKRGIVADFD